MDAALNTVDQKRAMQATGEQYVRQRDLDRQRKVQSLIADFLLRMSKAGNPGTRETKLWKRKSSRRSCETVQVWGLEYFRSSDVRRYLQLSTDGRVMSGLGGLVRDEWVDYRSSQKVNGLRDPDIDRLALSMAELLRDTGAG